MGEEAVVLLIKKKIDKYAKDKNNEPNVEPPPIYADGTDYMEENKGAIALNQLQEVLGKEKFNKILLDFIRKAPEQPKVFMDLYQKLLREVPVSEREAIVRLFETAERPELMK